MSKGVRPNFSKQKGELAFSGLCDYNTSHIMNTPQKQQLLQQIAVISAMERGKLSSYSFKDRSGFTGPYHKLQHWQDGKNHTRYVPTDELPAVEAALAGYAQYQQLTRQYADLIIAQTRQNIATSKKKISHPRSSSPKRRRSNS